MKIFNNDKLNRNVVEQSRPALVEGFNIPHPAVMIYTWICLLVAMQMLHGYALVLLAGVLLVSALRVCAVCFFTLLRRTRWVLLSLFLIYAYASQGEALWPQLGVLSPHVDGVVDGFAQLLRLLGMLAGLSILLALSSQTQLISGFYTLFFPLFLLGLSRERAAVRLALTLHYADSAILGNATNWRDNIEQMLEPMPVEPKDIELNVKQLSRRDWLLLAASSAAITGLWL